MDSRRSTRGFTKAGYAAVTATLALLASWSTAALGATSSLLPCDQVARDLTSLEVTVAALSIDLVDHVTTELDSANLANESDTTDTMAPLLYLTPRVATIMRDVFAPSANNQPRDSNKEVQASPLADSVEEAQSDDAADEIEINLPEFQRQMYRTDI